MMTGRIISDSAKNLRENRAPPLKIKDQRHFLPERDHVKKSKAVKVIALFIKEKNVKGSVALFIYYIEFN